MPNPFPGMNPYLEQAAIWPDFHHMFLAAMRQSLAELVRPRYFVRMEESVYLHELSADDRRPYIKPDVSIHPIANAPGVGVATLPPDAPRTVLIPAPVEELRVPYLEILDRDSLKTVTIIELLSPSNKQPGQDREQYWNKARLVLRSPTSFVEIDLLRGGPRLDWRDMPACDYYALVSRAKSRPRVDFWPIGMRDRLPIIPIPLGSADADVQLDLQAALHRAFEAAHYEDFIYRGQPEPPLNSTDAAWAASLIPAEGA